MQVEKPTRAAGESRDDHRSAERDRAGSLKLALGTEVTRIERDRVFLKNGTEESLPNDVVFTMLGREAPLDFFRRSGIRIAGEGTSRGWFALGAFLAFCVFVYFWKSGGFAEPWLDPWPGNMPAWLSSLGAWFQAQVADRSTLLGTLAVSLKSRSFYYTLA